MKGILAIVALMIALSFYGLSQSRNPNTGQSISDEQAVLQTNREISKRSCVRRQEIV